MTKPVQLIPSTLDEAVDQIVQTMTLDDKLAFAAEDPECPGALYHHGFGTSLRNNWGLWDKNSPLAQWFRERGLWHADDFSGCIFKSLWCRLNGLQFDIEKERAYYEEFWKESGLGFDGVELPAFKKPTWTRFLLDKFGKIVKGSRENHYE